MFLSSRMRLANELVRLSGRHAAHRFHSSLARPRDRQAALLKVLLRANADSRYGRQYHFDRIRSFEDFQAAVPIVDYEALQPWIDAIRQGEHGVLTAEPVLMMEKSGGSTAASKYIPFTASLRREFQQATSVWLADLQEQRPRLRELAAYWSISSGSGQREVTPGGLRVGFEDDSEYFGPVDRWVLKQLMMVPPEVRHLPDMELNRYVTLRHLLNGDRLGFISVWNPSFLTLLLGAFDRHADRLIHDLSRGTLTPPTPVEAGLQAALERGLTPQPALARRLSSRVKAGEPVLGTDLWPNLQLVSCWTSGVAARFLPELRRRFPGVEIQGKGLLATEGVVSFPLLDHPGAVLAVDSHVLEFVPLGSPAARPLLVDELTVGDRYSVLLTTGGGLYRYAMHDAIRVVGRVAATPLVEFVGKTGKVSDVVGEKLNELRVGALIEQILADLQVDCRFAMLAPEWGEPPYYALFLDCPDLRDDELLAVAQNLEARLRESHHYAYARDLGQLGALRPVRVDAGAVGRYHAGCEALGQRPGDIKPTYLHAAFGWTERFQAPPALQETT